MKRFLLFFSMVFFGLSEAGAEPPTNADDDQKYKFVWDEATRTGSCVDSAGREGLNPNKVGVCGDLRGLSLKGENLDGRDLSGAMLDGVNLRNARLNGANLRGISARGALFERAQMNGAYLRGANLSGARLTRAYLNGADLSETILSGATLADAIANGTSLTNSDVSGTKLDINLSTVKLHKAIFSVGTQLPFDVDEAKARGMIFQSLVRQPAATKGVPGK